MAGIPISDLEKTILTNDGPLIIGVDEAHVGACAGPLVAAAVALNYNDLPANIKDSKFYASESGREMVYKEIIAKTSYYHIEVLGVPFLNAISNIDSCAYYARYKAAMGVVWKLFNKKYAPNAILVDHFNFAETFLEESTGDPTLIVSDLNTELTTLLPKTKTMGVPDGDSKTLAIAAASVLAKVTSDRIMKELDLKYPEYGFKDHKGYVTAQHRKAIAKYGITEDYRLWYKDCASAKKRNILNPSPIADDSKVSFDQKTTISIFNNLNNA